MALAHRMGGQGIRAVPAFCSVLLKGMEGSVWKKSSSSWMEQEESKEGRQAVWLGMIT